MAFEQAGNRMHTINAVLGAAFGRSLEDPCGS